MNGLRKHALGTMNEKVEPATKRPAAMPSGERESVPNAFDKFFSSDEDADATEVNRLRPRRQSSRANSQLAATREDDAAVVDGSLAVLGRAGLVRCLNTDERVLAARRWEVSGNAARHGLRRGRLA